MFDSDDHGLLHSTPETHEALGTFGHSSDLAPLHTAADPWTLPATMPHDQHGLHLGSDATNGPAGNPDEYQNDWFFQGADGLCAPSSITEVLAEHAGVHLPDNQVVEARLSQLGFPSTFLTMEQSQEALQSLGVPCHLENAPAGGEQATLEQYLATGHSVILAVNASPIWYGSETYDNPTGGEDHALVVSAIDPQTGEVTLSDPGTPNGNEEHVSWSTFQDAWKASDFKMIVTDDAPGGADHSTAANAVSQLQSGSGTPPAPPAADPPTHPAPVAPAMPNLAVPGHGFPHIPGPILLPITFGAAAAATAALRRGRRRTRSPRPALTVPAQA